MAKSQIAWASGHRESLNSFSATWKLFGWRSRRSLRSVQSSKRQQLFRMHSNPICSIWFFAYLQSRHSCLGRRTVPSHGLKSGKHIWKQWYKTEQNAINVTSITEQQYIRFLVGWTALPTKQIWKMTAKRKERTIKLMMICFVSSFFFCDFHTLIDTKCCGFALKKSFMRRLWPIKSIRSGNCSAKNSVMSVIVVMRSKLWNGMNNVTVHDLSWFGSAIVMNFPRGQMCRKFSSIWNWNGEVIALD